VFKIDQVLGTASAYSVSYPQASSGASYQSLRLKYVSLIDKAFLFMG